jgi:hypothetical protein
MAKYRAFYFPSSVSPDLSATLVEYQPAALVRKPFRSIFDSYQRQLGNALGFGGVFFGFFGLFLGLFGRVFGGFLGLELGKFVWNQ